MSPREASRCCGRERVARAIDRKIAAQPYVGGARLAKPPRLDRSTLAGRLGSLRIAENDLPGGLDTQSWRVRPLPDARTRLFDDPVAAPLEAGIALSACAVARAKWSRSRRSTAST